MAFLNGFIYAACFPVCCGCCLEWIDEENRGKILTLWVGSLNVGGIAFY